MMVAITALLTETRLAAIIPKSKSKLPSIAAPVSVAFPLGIGRSGRSKASSLASNTSLKTTPPPYKPIVDISKYSSLNE